MAQLADQAPVVEYRVIRKLSVRLVPFLSLLYLINYLDHVNVGFAALAMNADLRLDAAAYGLGAGLFFIGYFSFEVASNIILHRVGARVWIARIMVTLGAGGLGHSIHPRRNQFLRGTRTARCGGGGLFPGDHLVSDLLVSPCAAVKIVALFFLAVPLSSVIGSPLSTLLIQHGNGLLGFDAGWRFMFFVEGLPAILCGVLVLVLLPSRPCHAKWLTEQESSVLEAHIAAEDARQVGMEIPTWAALTNPRVMALSIVYFGIVFGLYVLAFFLPQVIDGFQKQFHLRLSLIEIGLLTAIPYLFASVAMVLWARHSDRAGERARHVAIAAFVGAVAIAAALYMNSPLLVMTCITACAIGVYAAIPVFWQLPNAFLIGVGAAAGIGLINSFGNLSGFLGPYLTGWLQHLTGSFRPGLWVVAGLMVLAGVIALPFRTVDKRSPQDIAPAQ